MGSWRGTLARLVSGLPLFGGVFAGQRVLVTGHTGFKGSWLTRWLLDLGADVTGFALEPDTEPALFRDLGLAAHMDSHIGDIRDTRALTDVFLECRPQIVLHLAAQPLVRRSYDEPVYTFETNVIGTVNVLEAVRQTPETRAVVVVTTDKVYENPETGLPFAETQPLGGHDPYSASKACAEIVTASYRSSFFEGGHGAAIASARAGNVVGGGDWATDRILPDCVRALSAGVPITVRNPASVRPWQHVLDPLSGYLQLAATLLRDGSAAAEAFNFGPDPSERHTVGDVVDRVVAAWGSGTWQSPELGVQPHEAGQLRLGIDKAREQLGWKPVWDFEATIDRTVGWYRSYAENPATAERATAADLSAYTEALLEGLGRR